MDPSKINIEQLDKILKDLAKEGKKAVVRICPRCKSPNITWAPFALDPIGTCSQIAKFECKSCGWVGRLEIYMTNEPISEKEEEMLEDIHEMFEEDMSDDFFSEDE
ncbi:MAG: hypothetical protein ACTSRG_15415 [Candidatus Helarchaeota archaeon]